MRAIRSIRAITAMLALAVLVLAGCGGDGRGTQVTVGPTATDSAPAPGTTAAGADGGADPIGSFGLDTVSSPAFPIPSTELAPLLDVRHGAQSGFQRIVFELGGDQVPEYQVGYVDPPVREDGSGNVVTVAGGAFLGIRMTPASGVDLSGPEVVETYVGPDRIPVGAGGVEELVETGDFEAVLTWVVGVAGRQPFAVGVLQDPLRLVVDVQDGAETPSGQAAPATPTPAPVPAFTG